VFTASVTDLAAGMKDSGIGADFLDTFSVTYIPAHPRNETVLLYRLERTLIQADLFFHPPATEQYSRAGVSATSGFFTVLFVGGCAVKCAGVSATVFLEEGVRGGGSEGFRGGGSAGGGMGV
jgi:hypothetical protein